MPAYKTVWRPAANFSSERAVEKPVSRRMKRSSAGRPNQSVRSTRKYTTQPYNRTEGKVFRDFVSLRRYCSCMTSSRSSSELPSTTCGLYPNASTFFGNCTCLNIRDTHGTMQRLSQFLCVRYKKARCLFFYSLPAASHLLYPGREFLTGRSAAG